MTGKRAVELVRNKLASIQGEARVPLMKAHDGREYFLVKLRDDGVDVDNLNKFPFLPWSAFEVTVDLLGELDGTAAKGSAQSSAKLGSTKLPMNSVEGRIAERVYGQKAGEAVFRRGTSISNILVWAGVCRHKTGSLQLVPEREDYDWRTDD